ncbi:MAG: helix-turn-helix domain-containing protein [Sulfuriferula sp.]
MSIEMMNKVWKMDLPLGEKMVLLKLADRANDDGECWPGQESLASDCSMTDRGVRGVIEKLVTKGFLTVESRRCGQRNKSNLYHLHPEPRSGSKVSHPERHDILTRNDVPVVYKEEPPVEPPVVFTNVNTPPRASNQIPKPETPKIEFDAEQKSFTNISDERMEQWEDAYRGLDIDAELTRAESWYLANPRKRKRNHQRFLVNWLARAHDRARTPIKLKPKARAMP